MSTRSQPGTMPSTRPCMAARSRRLARLRLTAVPTVRPAATPTCTSDTSFARTARTSNGCAYDFPARRTRWKSWDRVSRNFRCNHAPLAGNAPTGLEAGKSARRHAVRFLPTNSLDVVVGFGSQLLAAAEAAALQYSASICRGHPRPKSVHADTAPDLGLICSLRHAVRSSLGGSGTRPYLRISARLNGSSTRIRGG